MINCTVINNETGEIINENFKIQEMEDIKKKKEHIEKDKLSREFKELQQNVFGNFVFFIFKNMNKLKEVLNDNDIVKLIYIGTFTKSTGALMLDNFKTHITKDKLKALLMIKDRKVFGTFYNKLIDNEIIFEQDNVLYINLEYFYYGKENTYRKLMGEKLEDFTRVYIQTIRNLYVNTSFKEHKRLSMVFQLLPYVNWKYNVLCTNIYETDTKVINPINISDVMEILGYNKSQISRFRKDFYSIKCKEYNMFMSVQGDANYLNSYIVVNPSVYYRGNDINQLEYLITLFGIKKKS